MTCPKDSAPGSCDPNAVDGDDDDSHAINAPSPGAPPTVDDDTADSAAPADDWGNVDDYQNQQVIDVPYAVYPSTTTALATVNSPSVPSSTLAPMSSPYYPGGAPVAESGTVDAEQLDVRVQPSRGQPDVDGVARLGTASLTPPTALFLLDRLCALLSWPDRAAIGDDRRNGDFSC